LRPSELLSLRVGFTDVLDIEDSQFFREFEPVV